MNRIMMGWSEMGSMVPNSDKPAEITRRDGPKGQG